MPGCSAVGCKNRSEDGFMMVVFPRDPERRKQWTLAVNREDQKRKGILWKPTNYCFLCEKHFDDDQWEKLRVDGKKKLKCNAVPTIFSHAVTKSPRQQSKKCLDSPLLNSKEAANSLVEVLDTPQTSYESASSMGDTGNQRGSLAEDLAILLNSGFSADITLHAGSFKMLAHKTVLVARSPFFAAILKSGRPNCHVELHDVEADVLLQLVIFMYTDRIPKLQTMAAKLLLAAEKLKLPVLEQKCKEQIARDMAKKQVAANALLAVSNGYTQQKNSAAVPNYTQTVQDISIEHCTEMSLNAIQTATEGPSAKKIRLENSEQTSENRHSEQVSAPTKIRVQCAEGKNSLNGTSPKLIVQTANTMQDTDVNHCIEMSLNPQRTSERSGAQKIKQESSIEASGNGSSVQVAIQKIPVQMQDTDVKHCIETSLNPQRTSERSGAQKIKEESIVETSGNVSSVQVAIPKIPVQNAEGKLITNGASPKVTVQTTNKGAGLKGKAPKISVQATDEGSHVNALSSKITVKATDERPCLQGFMAILRLQPTDNTSHLNGKSQKIPVLQVTSLGSHLNGQSPTVSVQATDNVSFCNGKLLTVPVSCLNEKLPTVPVCSTSEKSHLNVKSPTVPVQANGKRSRLNVKSRPVPSQADIEKSDLKDKSTVPVQVVIEESHLNGKMSRNTVQTSEESVRLSGTSSKIPHTIKKDESQKTTARSAKHKLSTKGAAVKSRHAVGASGAEKTKHNLHSAAECGSLEDVVTLLAQGVDVDARDKKKKTALLLAAENGHEAVVNYLLQESADVDAQDLDGWTPVHWATHNGHEEVVRCLLVAGADVSIRNRWQSTPLHSAAAWGHVNIAHMLLANSADVNAKDKDGSTPLHCAAKWCQLEVAEVLVQGGAVKNAKDKKGKMPLDMVRKHKQQHWAAIMR